jgi:hypothetical protein
MTSHDVYGFYVDANQVLLLKMLFSSNDEVLAHYQKWSEAVPFDSLDGGSFRLMPMLYKKLAPYGLRDERYEKIKGIYRYTLYKNNIILSGFHKIVQALHGAGIRMILLKGGALIIKYYSDLAVRPMNDIDILIEKHNVKKAMDILCELGWQYSLRIDIDQALRIYPSVTFLSRHGFELDLHWNIMNEYSEKHFVAELWRDASQAEYKDVPIYLLAAEDQVMHNCAHGVKWDALPTIRWIPDVLAILNAEPELSWTALARKCSERKLTMAVRSCLKYLKLNFNAPIPSDALDLLFAQTVSDEEKKMYAAYTAPLTFGNRIIRQWKLYKNIYQSRPWPAKILFFPAFLKEKSGIVKYSDCIAYLCSLAYRNLR